MLRKFKVAEEALYRQLDKELRLMPAVPLSQAIDTEMNMIYALYYTGNHPFYWGIRSLITKKNFKIAIFVGKTF